MRNRFLADTPALLAFLTDPGALGGRAADVFERAQQGELSVIVPAMVVAELIPLVEERKGSAGIIEIARRIARGGGFTAVGFDGDTLERIGALPRTLGLHDRAVAATALIFGAAVLTDDTRYRDIGLETVWD